jgi:outer membrane protein OmpA-like peptidoglycan-associated protein
MLRATCIAIAFCLLSFGGFSQGLKPTADQALFKVSVLKMDGSPRANNTVRFIDEVNDKKYSGKTDASGAFEVLLPKKISYKVYSEIFGNIQEVQLVEVPDMEGLLTFNMKLEYDMSGWDINMDGIQFDSGKSTLRSESYKALDEAVDFLKTSKTMTVEIQGHTDNVGSEESNGKLSQDRAAVVRAYLIKKGIAPNRLESNGYGESMPIADNADSKGRQKNRRTVFKIVSE